ncbi:MAG: hypothetical protein M3Q06_12265 [Bacteroidota bacterium]|nr:hypothetical protein [Bacteroidota bacterium]
MGCSKLMLLFFSLLFFCSNAIAQREQAIAGRHLSQEDLHEYLLYKSKREKTKAITTAVVGPLLTGTGIYLYTLRNTTRLPDGSVQEKHSSARILGLLVGSLGISTTICSIPLFVSAAETRKEAKLVLSQQSAAYLNRAISVPGVGLRVNF